MATIKFTPTDNSNAAFNQQTYDKLLESSLRGNILEAKEKLPDKELAPDHRSMPFKSPDDIRRIHEYFINRGEYRNNMLFICGINFGLRVSDLRALRFCDVINPDFTFKQTLVVFEQKTRNTRKVAKNRYIAINNCVKESILLYLQNTPNVTLSDYMFTSETSNRDYLIEKYNSDGDENEAKPTPLTKQAIDKLIKKTTKALGIEGHYSTHSFRKTFGYHYMMQHHNEPRALEVLQKTLGHSSASITLDYIGITDDEIVQGYADLGDYYNDILIKPYADAENIQTRA